MRRRSTSAGPAANLALATLLGCLLTLLGRPAATQEGDDEQINLIVGQQRVLTIPGLTRVAIGNPNVADVKIARNEDVIVTAIGQGVTELTVWQGTRIRTYSVGVSNIDVRKLGEEVKRLLGKREGISVRTSGDRVYIEGKALTLEDIERAEEISGLYKQVRSMVKLDPSAHQLIAEQINRVLASAGLVNARATVVGATVFLEGTVASEADLKKADILVTSISKNIQSLLRVGASRLVDAEVEFVELGINSHDKFGFLWPTDIGGSASGAWVRTFVMDNSSAAESNQFSLSASMGASFGVTMQFNDGVTRILARPNLVTASGQKAEFLAGGEVPIPMITQDRVSVEWKEYGIRLIITPTVDVGSIELKIEAEVSQVDEKVQVMGIPGFLSRKVKSTVMVHDGETVVLGGLLQRNEGKEVTKVPLFGHIPIIGELFKSRTFKEGQTDLVLFITPRLVDPASDRIKNTILDMTRRYKLGADEVGFSILD